MAVSADKKEKLAKRKKRAEKRRAMVEGRRPVAEVLDRKIPLTKAYIADQAGKRDAKFERLVTDIRATGCEIEYVTNDYLDRHSVHGAHQGVMVEMAPYQYADIADIVACAKGQKNSLIVLLDHVTDEGNFGAIVRSAEIVGADGVVIPNARSAKVGIGACTTSVGAVFQVPIAQVSNLATTIEMLKAEGYWVFGSTEHAEQVVWDADMSGRCVLIMGNEGDGISRLVLESCDDLVKLPQKGRIESLNVAQAATVMCFEWMRQSGVLGCE